MANETVKQESGTGTESQVDRTFTQQELDAIVSDRLKREREKYSDYDTLKEKASKFDKAEEANKTDLQKETDRANALEKELNAMKNAEAVRIIREKVAKETNVPANLLNGSTEEECKAQAQAIMAFKMPNAYPNVKDSGEISRTSKKSDAELFEEWFASAIK